MTDRQITMLHTLGAFYLRIGDADRALAVTAAAFEAAPRRPGLAATLIRCYVAAGEGGGALALLDRMDFADADDGERRALALLRSQSLWLAGRKAEARLLRASLLPAAPDGVDGAVR